MRKVLRMAYQVLLDTRYSILNTNNPLSYSHPMAVHSSDDWSLPIPEGQLSVDIFREGDTLIIRSPVAGARLADLDISVHGDLLTIRGTRSMQETISEQDWFHRECYWGIFSRSIILPLDVYPEKAEASLQEGLLTIRLPIRSSSHRLSIKPLTYVDSPQPDRSNHSRHDYSSRIT